MTARIIHNEEGYTLQVDHPLGDSFPARENANLARGDYFMFLTGGGKESVGKQIAAGYEAHVLEVVEA